jgi:hypothetical protein
VELPPRFLVTAPPECSSGNNHLVSHQDLLGGAAASVLGDSSTRVLFGKQLFGFLTKLAWVELPPQFWVTAPPECSSGNNHWFSHQDRLGGAATLVLCDSSTRVLFAKQLFGFLTKIAWVELPPQFWVTAPPECSLGNNHRFSHQDRLGGAATLVLCDSSTRVLFAKRPLGFSPRPLWWSCRLGFG